MIALHKSVADSYPTTPSSIQHNYFRYSALPRGKSLNTTVRHRGKRTLMGEGAKITSPEPTTKSPKNGWTKKHTRKRQKTSPRFPNRSHAKCAYPPNPYLPAPTGKNTTTTNVICLHKRQPVGIDIQILAHGRRRSTWPPARRWRVEA